MKKQSKKQKRVMKCYLAEVLSISMGYMFVGQDRVKEIVEHITKEDTEDAPMPFLINMAQNYLQWRYPELLNADMDHLHERVTEKADLSKEQRFANWLQECEFKGMKKRYMVKTMSNKVYADIIAHIITPTEEG